MSKNNDVWSTSDKIDIGISGCLLGEEVRWDGGHKHDRFLTDTVGAFVSYVRVCPEMDVGMGVPRPTVRLVNQDNRMRMIAPKTGEDWTVRMNRYARGKVKELSKLKLCGFVLKRASPTCGMERVKVYGGTSKMPAKDGVGLFAAELMRANPLLPVEEEGRLHDPGLRENFFERVFAYRRLLSFFTGRYRIGELVDFHSREKLLLMAHDPATYRELGRYVAQAKTISRQELSCEYPAKFLKGMKKLATKSKHFNVLQHVSGYFKKLLPDGDREEFHQMARDYKQGLVPLIAPITLARHHIRRHNLEYLLNQTYLEPHPKELMLRNHV